MVPRPPRLVGAAEGARGACEGAGHRCRGQLGPDVVATCCVRRRGRRGRSRRSSTSPIARRCRPASSPSPARRRHQLRRVHRGRRCETEVEAAHAVNEHGVRLLAAACRRVGAHLVHVSTDYVFDGTLDRAVPGGRSDQPAVGVRPIEARRASGPRSTCSVTTPRSCGRRGSAANTATTWSSSCDGWRPPATRCRFVDDQRGCPTFTADLAPALRSLAVDRPGGVFHLTNAGPVSWFEFVQEILVASGTIRGWSARSRPPSSTRPARRRVRRTACSTTPAGSPTGGRRSRDFREPLAELVARGIHPSRARVVRRRHRPRPGRADLRLLFVGINPGLWTAATQSHFSSPGNRFYPALLEAGIIERPIDRGVGMSDADRDHLLGRGSASATSLIAPRPRRPNSRGRTRAGR